MRLSRFLPFYLFYVFLHIESSATARGVNGGIGCAACTITTGIIMHLGEVNNETVIATAHKICAYAPSVIRERCNKTVAGLETILTSATLHSIFTPDIVCYGLHLCHVDEGENYCHLFPKPAINFHEAVQIFRFEVARDGGYRDVSSFDVCSLPLLHDLCNAFYDWFEDMHPAMDIDDDLYSPMQIGRGSFWRGRDCNDFTPRIYPGREPLDNDVVLDSNCNGIFGKRPEDGTPWEKALCRGTEGRGLVVVGDSVGAHFHMPESWFDATLFSLNALKNISDPLFDELDWPNMSFSTGFMNSSDPYLIQGNTDSIYLRLRERNRCNHRDYQNLCRNGETSYDHVNTSEKISRNMTDDKPVLLLYELLGNDVCNNVPDTLGNMTSPKQFRLNVLTFLDKLDKRLPPRSHIILVGLVNGSRIYTDMGERYHPIGRLHKNVKYKDVYRWFLCMQIGPCNGWMNPDAAIRSATSKRAKELSEVLRLIAKERTFTNFAVHYMDSPVEDVFRNWERAGGEAWQLYEPVDSFHPNQMAQPLITEVVWKRIMKYFPEAVGDENPNNDEIRKRFGNQGDH